jgi:hypothetical protein
MENWYQITREHFANNDGSELLARYENSPYTLVMSVFTDHKWNPSNFISKESQFWDSKEKQRKFLEYLGTTLNLKGMDAWYKVTQKQIHQNGGANLFMKYNGSPSKLIMSIFTEHN